jgi:ATP-dependent Clp protease ATP-binding subunit ClpA
MAEIKYTEYTNRALNGAMKYCKQFRHQFVMPEHLLLALFEQVQFTSALFSCNCNVTEFHRKLVTYLVSMEQMPGKADYEPEGSTQFGQMMDMAYQHVEFSSAPRLDVTHIIASIFQLPDSMARFLLAKVLGDKINEFMGELISQYEGDAPEEYEEEDDEATYSEPWRNLVVCLNDTVDKHNPLIGREKELERTIQVLCRKEKNNPLHVGEPGVGKTAIVYGLAARIVKGDVPERLRNCKIYQMEMGTMLAGTQYRGDFEKRIKQVMEGIGKEGNAIVYIDEIHNMVGAGRGSDGSLDASNMLKPYLESGDIRFVGSTTYDEYNRYFARSRGIVRRFQQIDIQEPSIDETINILKGLKKKYEQFHHVSYSADAIEFAVRASAKYVSDRFLPDKAIDLIDEAGAYREIHPTDKKTQKVDKALIADILAKVCKVDAVAMKEDDNTTLKTLETRIKAKIYGQDEAVKQVVESVQMAKAGLLDDNKPLASLLFVGPTGVGKTEVARVLAQELGIELVRFDMSEYTEKHTVAKLIGSPAGYVGYEDGGLLTDAIRKTPNCVLLLDEIEKAHQDIYNILLQVMDYARLTDNKGRHADFRNVILIMTSNAGAQFASQASVGFNGNTSRGEAMLVQVKKTFKPEFINRLSGTVVFHDMDCAMASLILDKKLGELQEKLTAKKVTMHLSDAARELLLTKGFTREYGAREMDRIIATMLKPLLMHEILFGKLKKGGMAEIEAMNDLKLIVKD